MFISQTPFLVLYITDVDIVHNFYQKIGAEVKQKEEDKVVVNFGGHDLHCILRTTEPFVDYHYIAETGHYGQGVILYIESDDIEKDQALIQQAGGTIVSPLFDNHWGAREFLFEDPSGYKFAVWQMK